jgi:L-amino acid N-acyltransferase YncA
MCNKEGSVFIAPVCHKLIKDMKFNIRCMSAQDWPAVSEIYREGIETGNATFEKSIPSWNEWDMAHLPKCRMVAALNDEIIAWAALTPVSGRCVYAGVAEVSLYVSAKFRGQGIGTEMLGQMVTESENEGIWTLQAGIFPENEASVRMHEKLGFRIVGRREKIGKMDAVWRDTVLLEKRSSKTGI